MSNASHMTHYVKFQHEHFSHWSPTESKEIDAKLSNDLHNQGSGSCLFLLNVWIKYNMATSRYITFGWLCSVSDYSNLSCSLQIVMKRKFKQWSSTISSISTKWTITSHFKHKKTTTYMALEIQDLAWDRHKAVVGLNRLIGSQSFPVDNWSSTYGFGNPNPGLGQAQSCGGVEPVNLIPIIPSW